MKFSYDVLQGGQNLLRKVIVKHSATQLEAGAAIMRGVTSGTNQGFGIVASGALTNVIGVLERVVKTTETDSLAAGTVELEAICSINPYGVYLCEYSQAAADDVAATSSSSSTTFNLTSIEDIQGGFIYVCVDTNGTSAASASSAAGQLQYITAATTNALTTKTALNPVATTASSIIKILPRWHQLVELNATATKLKSSAAAGSGRAVVIENYIEADNIPFQKLSAIKHSGLTGLDMQHVKFYAEIMFSDHVLNKLA